MSFRNKHSQNQQQLFVTLYLILYSIILTWAFLNTTMFKVPWPTAAVETVYALAALVIGIKILLVDELSRKEIWFYLFIAISFLGTIIHSAYLIPMLPFFFILGAKHVPFRKMVQIYCIIAGALLVITVIGSQLGIIENLVYGQRISYGFVYPTDFTAHIFFLVMGYYYLRKGRLTYAELTAILGLSVFSIVFCHARTNAICLFLAFAGFLYLKVRTHVSKKNGTVYRINPVLSKIFIFAMPICALLIIGLTFLYHQYPGIPILASIDRLLTGRLHWGSLGIAQYGVHLFGTAFQMVGWGGDTTPIEGYFFLDSSYVLMLIRYGFMIFISAVLVFVLGSWRAAKEKNIILLWIMALISIQCLFEHHLLEIAYNPFLFLIFSKISPENQAVFLS